MAQLVGGRNASDVVGEEASGYILGLDSSTQSFKASLLCSRTLTPLSEASIHFDSDLPHHHTHGGVLTSQSGDEVWSPVAMIVEALDLLLEKIKRLGWNLAAVKAVSASGQVS